MNLRIASAAAAALFLLPLPVQASPRDDVLEALGKCAALTDDHARLACYDQSAAALKAALNPPSPAQVFGQTPPGPAAAEDKKSWFGFDIGDIFGTPPNKQKTPEQFGSEALPPPPPPPTPPGTPPAPPQPESLQSITAAVTDFAYNPFGRFVVFLDNGQVWRQIEGDVGRAMFSKSAKNEVTISRGVLGSYNLVIAGSNKSFKVQRIK